MLKKIMTKISKRSSVTGSRTMGRTAEKSKNKDGKKKMKTAKGKSKTSSRNKKPTMASTRVRTSAPPQQQSNNGLYDELNGQDLNQLVYAEMPDMPVVPGQNSGEVLYTEVDTGEGGLHYADIAGTSSEPAGSGSGSGVQYTVVENARGQASRGSRAAQQSTVKSVVKGRAAKRAAAKKSAPPPAPKKSQTSKKSSKGGYRKKSRKNKRSRK